MLKRALKLTPEDKLWAKQVKERDGFMCIICGTMDRLSSHHIIPRENHETKYEINNGLTLCCTHHFFSRIISAHNNPIGLFFWMEKNRPEQLSWIREQQLLLNIDN